MVKIQVYTAKGAKSGELEFPKELTASSNAEFLAQALYVFEDRSHKGTNKVKTRAEVNLSTRKIYRQKGTGGARHGDKKAPIFVGGGVAHGPKGVKRVLSLSKKQNKFALKLVLTQKSKDKLVAFVNGIGSLGKTKEAAKLLIEVARDMGKKSSENALVVLGNDKKETVKYFRNIKNINLAFWKDLNLLQVHAAKFVVIDNDAVSESNKVIKRKENSVKAKIAKTKSAAKKVQNNKVTKKSKK